MTGLTPPAPRARPPAPREDLHRSDPWLPTELRRASGYRDADTAGHVNSPGLRGPQRPAGKIPGTIRVLCVGGSATAENLISMGLRLLDFEPDIVVCYEGYDDFNPSRHPGFGSDYAHWRDRAVVSRRPWLERLRIYTRLRSVTDRLRAHPGFFTWLPGFVPGLTLAGVREAFDRHNEVIRSVAAETGARVADAALLVPPDPSLFVDHVHFNALGADRFAGAIAGAVARLLPERSRPAAGQPLPAPARASSATTSR